MKKTLFSLIFIFICFLAGSAQSRSEYQIIKSVFGIEKTNYIEQQMELNENEEKVFWPIYEDYEIARAKFSGKRWDVLQKYASNYHSLSRSDAKELTNDWLRFEKKELKLKNKYFNFMSNKLSPVKASKFVQLEEFIHSKVKYAILGDLPFVQE